MNTRKLLTAVEYKGADIVYKVEQSVDLKVMILLKSSSSWIYLIVLKTHNF